MSETVIYPSGYSYRGPAVQEQMFFRVLKTYSFNDAKNMLYNAISQGAENNGLILLRTDLSSSSGFAYHEFTATTSYFNPNQPMGGTGSLAFPVALLIYAVAVILSLILVYYIIVEVKEIVYGPPGSTEGGISGTVALVAIALLGIMILKR